MQTKSVVMDFLAKRGFKVFKRVLKLSARIRGLKKNPPR